MASLGRKIAFAAFVATIGAASSSAAEDLSKGIPSREALQRKTALKLAGLATFVATSCRDLQLDQERFKRAIAGLGVNIQDLSDEKTKFAYLEYTMTYKQDVKANCARAKTEFGPKGKTLPDLFKVVEVPPKPPAAGLPVPGAETPGGKAPDAKAPDATAPNPAKPDAKKP